VTSTTKPFEQQLELQFERPVDRQIDRQIDRRCPPDGRLNNGQSYEELCGE